MSSKVRLSVLGAVVVAVLAILFWPVSTVPTVQESPDSFAAFSEEFSPDPEPYRAFIEARQAGKPIVLEFYART